MYRNLHGLYEFANNSGSARKAKESFLDSIKHALTSEELDTENFYQQAEFFLKLLEEKKLILRKTQRPNHSHILPSLFITGSSNLTRAGLSLQDEFNVEIKDYGFEEAERYFDDLWKSSVEISLFEAYA